MSGSKFAVFDIDGTLVRWQLYHAVANALIKSTINPSLYESVQRSRKNWKQRTHSQSFREYELALVAAHEATLQELTTDQFNQAAAEVFEEHKDQVYTFTRDLITTLKKEGYFLLAISGSHTELVAKIADYYGFDDYVGTEYLHADGRFTGEKILGSTNKNQTLEAFIAKHKLSLKDSYAVGDSEGDIPMLKMVENPIAFNPTQGLLDTAKAEGWQVVVERKNVVYKLERAKKDGHGSYILA